MQNGKDIEKFERPFREQEPDNFFCGVHYLSLIGSWQVSQIPATLQIPASEFSQATDSDCKDACNVKQLVFPNILAGR